MSNGESVASSQFSPLGAVGPDRLPLEVVDLLKLALRRGATDVLLAVDRPPSFRVSATLTPAEELPPPGPDAIVRVAHTLLGEGGIADPVEFVHADKLSRVEQREVGRDTPSFSRALRSVVRQSPDVVLVGEMRDVETIQTVLSLAETGHLTLATLHTSSCANTVHRIIDVFAEDRQAQIRAQLALSLEAVLSLALLPRIGGGLALATEVMMGTAAIRAMIRDGRAHQLYGAIQAGQQVSMRTMNHSLAALVKRRHVALEDAEARSPDVKELRQLLAP